MIEMFLTIFLLTSLLVEEVLLFVLQWLTKCYTMFFGIDIYNIYIYIYNVYILVRIYIIYIYLPPLLSIYSVINYR